MNIQQMIINQVDKRLTSAYGINILIERNEAVAIVTQ